MAPPLVPRALEGKLALVTGASRGIGAAIAENLASKGATLILNYTSESSKTPTEELSAKLLSTYSVPSYIIQADMGSLTGPSALIAAAKAAREAAGHPFRLDIIINNAGVAVNDFLPAIQAADFDTGYHVNVRGPLLLLQAAQPHLPTDRSGRIVNISSISAQAGFVGQSIYGGTKAALDAMTRTWARELSENATVNSINPGPVATSMWFGNSEAFMEGIRPFIQGAPLERIRPELDDKELVEGAEAAGGRPAYAWEIAGVVGMLCTRDAGWVTGQVVSANGGMRFGTG
ncbi:hypothetical protein VE03_04581 [Pseudogymnoascus sp. 23342-1-I1]|nr:hypothetical protein VE03_04581 [Pseudogymnoascus sp. 23342-1-I1]